MKSACFSLLHVEDDALWRAAVKTALSAQFRFSHYLEAENGSKGIYLCQKIQPEIILLDLRLPDVQGLDLVPVFIKANPRGKIALFTSKSDVATLFEAHQATFVGLIWKSADFLEILPAALRAISEGKRYYSPDVSDAMRSLSRNPHAFHKMLSNREISLLRFLGAGQSDEEISKLFCISPYTAKSHRHSIMGKLGLHRTSQLIHWCIKNGFC